MLDVLIMPFSVDGLKLVDFRVLLLQRCPKLFAMHVALYRFPFDIERIGFLTYFHRPVLS